MREIKLRESLLADDDDRDRVRDTTERESESLALQASCFAVNFISLSHGAGHKISYPYLHLFSVVFVFRHGCLSAFQTAASSMQMRPHI